jgi:hypothetical protein
MFITLIAEQCTPLERPALQVYEQKGWRVIALRSQSTFTIFVYLRAYTTPRPHCFSFLLQLVLLPVLCVIKTRGSFALRQEH